MQFDHLTDAELDDLIEAQLKAVCTDLRNAAAANALEQALIELEIRSAVHSWNCEALAA